MFSSAGNSQVSRGRTTRIMLRSIGTRMRPPSKARAKPAPRETQTDHLRPFKAASFVFTACKTQHMRDARVRERHNTYLTVPPIAKEEEVETVEDNVEGEPPGSEQLATEPALSHVCVISRRKRPQRFICIKRVKSGSCRTKGNKKKGKGKGTKKKGGRRRGTW